VFEFSLTFTRQVISLYHLSHLASLFFVLGIFKIEPRELFVLNLDNLELFVSSSLVSRIADVSHLHPAICTHCIVTLLVSFPLL
jgi:hypothetical protein